MRRILLLCSHETRARFGQPIEEALRKAELDVEVRDSWILASEVRAHSLVVTDEGSLPPLQWPLAAGLEKTSHSLYVLATPDSSVPGIVHAKQILDKYDVQVLYSDTLEALTRVVSNAATRLSALVRR
jgi:hypothetical protein